MTIAWYDPPAQNGISTPCLLHDLDLKVTSPGGEQVWGNSQGKAPGGGGDGGGGQPPTDDYSGQWPPFSMEASADRLNSNERVTMATPEAGQYTISVKVRGQRTSTAIYCHRPHSGQMMMVMVMTSILT